MQMKALSGIMVQILILRAGSEQRASTRLDLSYKTPRAIVIYSRAEVWPNGWNTQTAIAFVEPGFFGAAAEHNLSTAAW